MCRFLRKQANTGFMYLPDKVLNIIWPDDRELNISTIDHCKGARCMMDMFEGSWRLSTEIVALRAKPNDFYQPLPFLFPADEEPKRSESDDVL